MRHGRGEHSRPAPRQSLNHINKYTTETSGDAEDPDGRELKAIHLSPELAFYRLKCKDERRCPNRLRPSKWARDLSPAGYC
jgi:hypothetical protein